MDATLPVVKEEPRLYKEETDYAAPSDLPYFSQSRFHKYQSNPVFAQIRHQFNPNVRKDQGVASSAHTSVSRNDTIPNPNTNSPLGPRMSVSSRRDIVENWLSSCVHPGASSTEPDHSDGVDSDNYFQTPLDIPAVVSTFKATLENYGISQRFAARYIMEETSQGNLSFLLDKGRLKKWGELSHRGRLPYIRMKEWLDNKDLQMATMELLKGVKAIKKSGQKEACNKREKFSLFQLSVLCRLFEENSNPSMGTRIAISEKLNIHIERINVWFQNQRARGFPAKKILEQSFGGLQNKDSKKQPTSNCGHHLQNDTTPFQGSTLLNFSSNHVKENPSVSDLDLNAICEQPSLTRSSMFGTHVTDSKLIDIPGRSFSGNNVPADLLNTPLTSNESLFAMTTNSRVKPEYNTILNLQNSQTNHSSVMGKFTKYFNNYGETRSPTNTNIEQSYKDNLLQSNCRSGNLKRNLEMSSTSEEPKKQRVNVPFFRGKGSHTIISSRHRSENDSLERQEEWENTTFGTNLTVGNQRPLAYMQMNHSSLINRTTADIRVSETVMSPGIFSMSKSEKTNMTKLLDRKLLDISDQTMNRTGLALPLSHLSATSAGTRDTMKTFNKQNNILSSQTPFGLIPSDTFGIPTLSPDEQLSTLSCSQTHNINMPSERTQNSQFGTNPASLLKQTFIKTTTAAKQNYACTKACSFTLSQIPVMQTSANQFQLSKSNKSQVSCKDEPSSHPIEDIFHPDSTLHVIKLMCTQLLGKQSSAEMKELEIPDLD